MLRWFTSLNFYSLIVATLLIPMGTAFVGCDVNEGPAEEIGEEIDEAGEELQDEVDDATNE